MTILFLAWFAGGALLVQIVQSALSEILRTKTISAGLFAFAVLLTAGGYINAVEIDAFGFPAAIFLLNILALRYRSP